MPQLLSLHDGGGMAMYIQVQVLAFKLSRVAQLLSLQIGGGAIFTLTVSISCPQAFWAAILNIT